MRRLMIKKKTISIHESKLIMDYITNPNPHQIIRLVGGPLKDSKYIIPMDCEYIILEYIDSKMGNTPFTVEYRKKRIYDVGVWEFQFHQSYLTEPGIIKEDEFEEDYLNHKDGDDWESEGEEWKGN